MTCRKLLKISSTAWVELDAPVAAEWLPPYSDAIKQGIFEIWSERLAFELSARVFRASSRLKAIVQRFQ
jgi:hypothetical protein